MTKVIIVRHGQTDFNAGGAISSLCRDSGLSEIGLKQAEEFAKKITSPPDLFVTSTYKRAVQTAKPLLSKFPKVPLETWEIAEFECLGNHRYDDQKTIDSLKSLFDEFFERNDPNECDGEGAESFSTFLQRARNFIRDSKTREVNKIIEISHGFFIKLVKMLIESGNEKKDEKEDEKILMQSFYEYSKKNNFANCAAFEF
jgi:broad specificity phosphatase PhoE